MEDKKNVQRRSRIGRVIADNSAQTIKVEVEGMIQHPRFKKYIKRQYTFTVHDPEERCQLGDLVKIEECRPISKTKKWVVREVVEKASGKAKEKVKEISDDLSGINTQGS